MVFVVKYLKIRRGCCLYEALCGHLVHGKCWCGVCASVALWLIWAILLLLRLIKHWGNRCKWNQCPNMWWWARRGERVDRKRDKTNVCLKTLLPRSRVLELYFTETTGIWREQKRPSAYTVIAQKKVINCCWTFCYRLARSPSAEQLSLEYFYSIAVGIGSF